MTSRMLLATPAYGGQVSAHYMTGVIDLTRAYPEMGVFLLTGESLIGRARNKIASVFLEDDSYSHLLFVDADIIPTVREVDRLLTADKPVVTGLYALKTINWAAYVGLNEYKNPMEAAAAGLQSASHVSPDTTEDDGFVRTVDTTTGLMLISREVLEGIIEQGLAEEYLDDTVGSNGAKRWNFFPTVIEDGRLLSEDFAFCRIVEKAGFECWADLGGDLLSHVGSYIYGGY